MLGEKNPATRPPSTTTIRIGIPAPSIKAKSNAIASPATAPITLPATSSLRRIRSKESAPESRRPILSARACRGASTRSPNGRSSSLVSSLGASVMAWRTASERVTPPSAPSPTAVATRTSASTTSITPMRKNRITSHLHLRESAHPEHADAEQRRGPEQHQPADRLGEERHDVVTVGAHEIEQEHRRETAEHPGRHLALGRESGDLATHVLALTHGRGDGVEQLGEVASDLT